MMEFVDIVGLVKGVFKGEGLGNQFLINICEIEVIGYVVCCFENDNIIYVVGKVNLVEDIDVINIELVLVDFDICECVIYCVQKKVKGGDKDVKVELVVLEKCLLYLVEVGMLCLLDLMDEDKVVICYLSFLMLKLIMYIVNVNEDGFENNFYLDQVCEIVVKEGLVVVLVCVVVEVDIVELDDDECDEFMVELGLEELGLNCVICVGYCFLNFQIYFIVGVKEVCVWIILVGVIVLQVVGKIYIDFEKGFICV